MYIYFAKKMNLNAYYKCKYLYEIKCNNGNMVIGFDHAIYNTI